MSYKVIFKTRWADFDPNNHMRHTAYNDYAAECRVRFFNDNQLTLTQLNLQNVGPVLFSENTQFFREITLSEDITVELFLKGQSENGERFKFLHKIYKQNGILAAEIEVHGSWLDLIQRKLAKQAPQQAKSAFDSLEKTNDFEMIPLLNK